MSKFKFPSLREKNIKMHIIEVESIYDAIFLTSALEKEGFLRSASCSSIYKPSKRELAFPFYNALIEVLTWKENGRYEYQLFVKDVEPEVENEI